MRVPVCGRFYPNKGGVAGYVNRMRVKSPTKWGSQIAEMIFQTRSRTEASVICQSRCFPFCILLFGRMRCRRTTNGDHDRIR
ncbi:DUF6783 domain-containing protein [Blautia faecicola]|uniref:DUF6783 domain-containing protein n=1 Tax=Blautia faecicola TaxID=2509240 RepID=UPI002FE52C93